MTARAVPLGLRLFMEGVEIPVISAQVTLQPDSPAVAAIQVIPADTALALLPRTLVHLFYLDVSTFDEIGPESQKPDDATSRGQDDLNRFVAPDRFYKLMFSGQVIGLNYSKTPVSRQLVLQCMDLSIYWDTCYQWLADYSASGDALTDKRHNFVGAGQGLFDNVAGGHKWVIGNILNSKPRSPEYRNTKGLLGGLIHLLESIGGIRRRSGGSHVFEGYNGVNDFFTIGELRFNLLGMIGAVQGDNTSTRLYASKAFRSWLKNGMTSQGSLLSFRDILNNVNRYIFHNIYPNPCARYVPGATRPGTRSVNVPMTTFAGSPVGSTLTSRLKKLRSSLVLAWEKFSRAADGMEAVNNASHGDTILRSQVREVASLISFAEGSLNTDDKDDFISNLEWIKSNIEDASKVFLKNGEPIYSYIGIDDTWGELLSKSEKARDIVADTIPLIDGVTGKKSSGTKKVNKKATIELGDSLFTQLILPETFFVPPPRCNVIFPDEYYQLSYNRNFMREVTRLSLQGGMGLIGGGRGSKILGRQYFAPNIQDTEGKNLMVTRQYGGRIILPHEVHSGIVPKFEHVSQGHRWGVKAAGAKTNVQKVGYLQRLANFNFYLHRWSSRTMQVGAVFLPRLVLGLPAVLIDRATPPPHVLEAIQKELGRDMKPTQYLGKIANMTHSISQSGGSTTAAFSHCRTHKAVDDEFLGQLVREEKARKRLRTFKIEPEKLGVEKKTNIAGYVHMLNLNLDHHRALVKGVYIEEFGGKVVSVKATGDYEMPIHDAWDWGIGTAGADHAKYARGKVVTLPKILEVVLTGGTIHARSVDVAVEDLMIPGWYSDVWRKKRIGKEVYQPLLGTWAITDDVDINKESQDKLLQQWKNDIAEADTGDETLLVTEGTEEDHLTVGALATGSIEAAIDSLGILYGMIQSREGNVHEFIEKYTWRPIASILDVLGSSNLEYDDQGNVANKDTMVEGFHSRGFGPYNVNGKDAMKALFPGLDVSKIKTHERPSLINSKKKGGIKPDLDPRGPAQQRVYAYRAELQITKTSSGK